MRFNADNSFQRRQFVSTQPNGDHTMASHRQGLWRPLLGLGFAVAGADKLLAMGGYPRLFRNWGWSAEAMRGVGAGEFIGGVLIACPPAQRLGALLLTLVCC
jgi:uncharacterized membrane protein YphA (DoxX/SURF4 family)